MNPQQNNYPPLTPPTPPPTPVPVYDNYATMQPNNRFGKQFFALLSLIVLAIAVYIGTTAYITKQTTGLLQVNTNDKQATLSITQLNRQAVVIGVGSAKVRLKSGTYQLAASSKGYQTITAVTVYKKQTTTKSISVQPDITQPPQQVLATTKTYVQAREDAIGADQASPTSWLATIQPLSTSSWYSTLTSGGTSTTSSVPASYYTAHSSDYIVKTNLSSCDWYATLSTSGTITCQLTDQVVNQKTNALVTTNSIPFGWTATGTQPPVILDFVQQGGTWLVENDESGSN